MICEILHDVRIETENAKLMRAHDAGGELHKENLMVERVALIIVI